MPDYFGANTEGEAKTIAHEKIFLIRDAHHQFQ